ncbi:17920_t:CDS:1, partial [Rhizophagus irregularis]
NMMKIIQHSHDEKTSCHMVKNIIKYDEKYDQHDGKSSCQHDEKLSCQHDEKSSCKHDEKLSTF